MKQEHWQRIDELLDSALNRAPEQRAKFLTDACSGDEILRAEVESLLAHHAQADDFLETPPGDIAADILELNCPRLTDGQLIDHYKVLCLLGAGGMGEVYLALDTQLGRQVALKLLPSRFTEDATLVARFEQEARAVSALNHPNIVIIHEIGKVEGTHFIVTEFIKGQTLRHRMSGTTPTLMEVLNIAIQVATALEAAHAAGIVHRDIKPENIMLRPDGLTKVLDFGLAKLVEAQRSPDYSAATTKGDLKTGAGMVMGTAQYMSPEQARGQNVDTRTDVWSLGVVLYEMLTGNAPFGGETPSHAIVAVLENEPSPLARQAAAFPAELERIVKKALRKNKEERYQSVKDFALDLKALKQELEAGRSLALSPDIRARAGSRKHIAAVFIVAFVIMAVAVIAYFGRREPPLTSIAVLPFTNAESNPNAVYLAAGISESISNSLSQLPQLRVAPTLLANEGKRAELDPRTLGHDLDVRTLLAGSVAQHGDDIEVQVELIDTENASQLWGEHYSRKLKDLVALKQQITREVSENLRLQLTGEQQNSLAKGNAEDSEAYRLYLQGRYYWRMPTDQEHLKSGEFFQKAIEKDPSYALAYAGLADYYGLIGSLGLMPSRESWPKSQEAAVQALARGPTLGEVRHSLGATRMWYLWDWPGAEAEFKLAIKLAPNFRETYSLYTRLLYVTGRFDEAIAMSKRARNIDPDTPRARKGATSPEILYVSGQYERAIEEYRKIPEKDFSIAMRINLANALLETGRAKEALEEISKVEPMARNGRPRQLARVAYVYAASGERAKALKLLGDIQSTTKSFNLPYSLAAIHTALGNKEQAFQWLDRALDEHGNEVIDLKVDPRFKPLHQDPRFRQLLGRLHLTPTEPVR